MSPANTKSLTTSAQKPKNRKQSKPCQKQNVKLRLEQYWKKKTVKKRNIRLIKPQKSHQAKKPYIKPKTKSSKAKSSLVV